MISLLSAHKFLSIIVIQFVRLLESQIVISVHTLYINLVADTDCAVFSLHTISVLYASHDHVVAQILAVPFSWKFTVYTLFVIAYIIVSSLKVSLSHTSYSHSVAQLSVLHHIISHPSRIIVGAFNDDTSGVSLKQRILFQYFVLLLLKRLEESSSFMLIACLFVDDHKNAIVPLELTLLFRLRRPASGSLKSSLNSQTSVLSSCHSACFHIFIIQVNSHIVGIW